MRTIVRSERDKKQYEAPERLAVIGAGAIGNAMAQVFAAAGFSVRLWDSSEAARGGAIDRIAAIDASLREHGLVEEQAGAILERVEVVDDLPSALEGVVYVQECVPEEVSLKRELFERLDELCGQDTVLASSTSAIMPSAFAAGLEGAHRCLVAHPANPPTLLRVVEVVPAPFTGAGAVAKTRALLCAAGLAPVVVRKELPGFVFNRLQGAMLREAYCLVRDGVASVDDIDRLVRDGLALRWSVIGPFETADLNRRGGIRRHAAIMGDAYAAMGAVRGQDDPWTESLVAEVDAQRRALLPLADWDDRVAWRDRELARLVAWRRRRNPD